MTETVTPSPLFQADIEVSFGDCDPAGIVFYPNFFRWADGLFHSYLNRVAGGHAALCATLSAKGLGLMKAEMAFRRPAAPGDVLRLAIDGIEWSARTFSVSYSARQHGEIVCDGVETRGVFLLDGDRIRAGTTDALRQLLAR